MTIKNDKVTGLKPLVAVVMGSKSDWETMKETCVLLEELAVPYLKQVVSAHRTPDLMFEFAEKAEGQGLKIIIAGAGGAAHLPGMLAAKTQLPVIGVPIESKSLKGLDSLLSIVQMPSGIPVATVAIGKAGAKNAALLAAAILGLQALEPKLQAQINKNLQAFRQKQTTEALDSSSQLI